MHYDLATLREFAAELSMEADLVSEGLLHISFGQGVVLVFKNYAEPDGPDCLIAFEGSPWHQHGKLGLMKGEGYYIDLDELEVLQGIKEGKLVLGERLVDGELRRRWLTHVEEPQSLQYMEPKEELRFRRLA